jgi:hypothetical protein
MGFLDGLVQGEPGYYSSFSIVHFLSGFVPHSLWLWWVPAEEWISLLALSTLACLFELLENEPKAAKTVWSWLGNATSTYRADSLKNAVSDILFLIAGWFVAQVVYMLSPGHATFFVLLGVAALLFVAFLVLNRLEREDWQKRRTEVGVTTASDAPTDAPTVRFVL